MFRNGLQFWHIVVLLLVVLLLFGANKLPDVAKSVGKSMKILKEEVKDLRDEPGDSSPAANPPAGPSGTTDSTRSRDESTGGNGAATS
jgi:sec-independent protein translocase protein TatA